MSKEKEVVGVNCRAPRGFSERREDGTKGCGGQQATVLFKMTVPTGGTCIRYECTKCKRPFSITF